MKTSIKPFSLQALFYRKERSSCNDTTLFASLKLIIRAKIMASFYHPSVFS